MRVMVMGSIPERRAISLVARGPNPDAFFNAGRALGWALASHGAEVIVGSTSRWTIDPHIVAGYEDYCGQHPQVDRSIEVQFPIDEDNEQYTSGRPGSPTNLRFTRLENDAETSSPHRWITSHFSALRRADLLITIGGGSSTRTVGSFAVSSQVPVLAVREYGGAAAEVFTMARHTYASEMPRLGAHPTRDIAGRLVSFGVALVNSRVRGTHSYFISYSWKNHGPADFVEVMLRRFDRVVFRDENSVKAGQELSSQLMALIQEADTFVGLWSESYRDSTWCRSEIEHAFASRTAGGKPRRIVVLELDDTSTPAEAQDFVRMAGKSRESLDLSLRRVITQEPT